MEEKKISLKIEEKKPLKKVEETHKARKESKEIDKKKVKSDNK